jgi:hypothetical protein
MTPPASGVPAEEIARLSLSSQTVHADDFISAHRAVAPAMHVSTTFRYSDDPEELKHNADPSKLGDWNNPDVSTWEQACFSEEDPLLEHPWETLLFVLWSVGDGRAHNLV